MAYETYEEFWPFYLREHSRPITRALHYIGTSCALGWILGAVFGGRPMMLLGAVLSGYAFAWIGHFGFEKNRPATFKYPLYSFASDWKMWAMFLTGRIGPELQKAGVVPMGQPAPRP